MAQIGALWIKTNVKKEKYVVISLDDMDNIGEKIGLVAYKNKNKMNARQPDYIVYPMNDDKDEPVSEAMEI